MKNLKIVFMGTPNFASTILEGLIANNYQIIGVVTQPDKEVGRKKVLTPSKVKEVALLNNIPVYQPLKIRNDYQDILNLKPDLIITAAYGQIIPKALLDLPPYGCINIHGSLLPKYRGGSPIQRAIISGEIETGITIMYMAEKMDAGDIICQESIEILKEDTNSSLFDKLALLGRKMILELLPNIDNIKAIPQDESKVTFAYNLTKEDEFINFNDDVINVYNHIRGLLNTPGAFSVLEGRKYKFHKVDYEINNNTEGGKILGLKNNKLEISSINGSILVEMIQPEGKNVMNAKDFYNGQGKSLIGKSFEENYE